MRTAAAACALLLSAACGGVGSVGSAGSTGDPDDPTTGTPSTSGAQTGSSEETGTAEPWDVAPPAGGMRRLLAHQYISAVELLLGKAAADAATPPADGSVGGFDSVAAYELAMPPVAVAAYEASANAIAVAVVNNPSRLAEAVPCVTEGPRDETCYADLARDFGRLLWRRPLTEDEILDVLDLGIQGRVWGEGDFDAGLTYALLGMLQAPSFLYIVETGEVDEAGDRALTQYETATRLSFFLTGRTPDTALLDIAESDGLRTEEQRREVAWALLEEPEARTQVQRFYAELFTLRDLEDKAKDPELFPVWSPDVARSMREETMRLVEHIAFEVDGNILNLLDADFTFVDDTLAQFYGVFGPDGGWLQVNFPAEQRRAGILTQPAFLAAKSFTNRNSPTRRGLFIQDRILCNDIAPPPPEVNAVLPEPDESATLRELLELHMENEQCRVCHGLIDPLGFAYENFDAIGAYRKRDNGSPIDASGEVQSVGEFGDAADLAALLREDSRVPGCLLRNLYRYGLGVAKLDDQDEGFDRLEERFAELNSNFLSIAVEMAVSPLFMQVEAPK